MKWIKFTKSNLIAFVAVLFFSFNFVLPVKRAGAQHYVVQLAASKDFIDLSEFPEKFGISDSIQEIVDKDWIRYVVGNFENRKMAALYAADLMAKTGMKGAFPKLIEDYSENKDTAQQTAAPLALDTFTTDSVKVQDESGIVTAKQESGATASEKNTSIKFNNSEKQEQITFSFTERNLLLKFIFGEENLMAFKSKLLKYGDNHFSSKRRTNYMRLVNQIFSYPIVIVFSILILIFIIHVILLLFFLSYSNRLKNYNERYNKVYGSLYESIVLSYVFSDIDWETFYKKLKYIKLAKNRKILISILLNLHDNLKGGVDALIPEIYEKLNLKKDSIKTANSFLYYKKVKGLHELTFLCPEEALKIIPKLLKHSNESIRAEAQKAFILLHPENPFDFLRTLQKPFSRWTQLSAFHLLRLPQLQIPSFSRYLLSSHNGVRIFCLQMINYFQQLENVTLIFNLVDSNKELTRFLSYRAINNLRLYDGRVLIKKQYRDETEKNKLEIIKALRKIGTDEDIDFLEIIFKSESTALQIEACRSMYYMSSESNKRLLNVSRSVIPNLELFIAHVTDKRN